MARMTRLQARWAITILAFAGAAVSAVAHLSAQIVEFRDYHGKQIACGSSGLFGFGAACGTQYYDSVFVGTILKVNPVSETEFSAFIAPEEVFKGFPAPEITVGTSQGACMPEMYVGDRWLFYLGKDEKKDGLILAYGSPSGPVDAKGADIARLRRLSTLEGKGLIMGKVLVADKAQEPEREPIPRPDHTVAATRLGDGKVFSTVSDANGDFDFGPLPAGQYHLNPNTVSGLWTMWFGDAMVEARGCMNYTFDLKVDGIIRGTVIQPEGTKQRTWLVGAESEGEQDVYGSSAFTDASGHFEIHDLRPGRYVIGIEIAGETSQPGLNYGVYAPGVTERSQATVVKLGEAAHRDGVEIRIPADAIP
jgi:hypothetical protein